MLGKINAIANLAVHDIGKARAFYEQILGLTVAGKENHELVVYRSGDSTMNVYRSDHAGSNQATAVTWAVGDQIDAIAAALKSKGVKFEHYDLPGMTREGNVHVGGDMRIAWFKDPDGNILGLTND